MSVLRHRGKLYCMDSTCYHAGGPLGNGDIEDVNGESCLVCPWHLYQVSLEDGSKFYQPLIMTADKKMVPGGWKKKENAQRVHKVEERADGIYVTLNLDGKWDSDSYGGMSTCGGSSQASNKPVHSKRSFGLPQRSGHVLRGNSSSMPPPQGTMPGLAPPPQGSMPGAMPPYMGRSDVSTSLASLTTTEHDDIDSLEGAAAGGNVAAEMGADDVEWTQLVVAVKQQHSDSSLSLKLDATTFDGAQEVLRRLYSITNDFGDGTIVDVEDLFDTRHLDIGVMSGNVLGSELVHRPYTPARSAKRSLEASSNHLVPLEIRVYEKGEVSPRLASLNIGDKVFARPGTVKASESTLNKAFPSLQGLKNVFLFAGGSGVTPMLQIVQNAIDANAGLQVTIICANKSPPHILGKDALHTLAAEAKLPTKVRVIHLLTDASESPANEDFTEYIIGTRVDNVNFLQDIVQVSGRPDSVYGWSGPPGFMAALKTALVDNLGIPLSRCVEYSG